MRLGLRLRNFYEPCHQLTKGAPHAHSRQWTAAAAAGAHSRHTGIQPSNWCRNASLTGGGGPLDVAIRAVTLTVTSTNGHTFEGKVPPGGHLSYRVI